MDGYRKRKPGLHHKDAVLGEKRKKYGSVLNKAILDTCACFLPCLNCIRCELGDSNKEVRIFSLWLLHLYQNSSLKEWHTVFQFFSSNGLLSVLKLFSFCVACDTKRSHLFSSSHHTYFFIPLFSILSLPTTFSLKCCIPLEAFRYLAMLGSSLCLMRISTSFISPKSCEVNTNSKVNEVGRNTGSACLLPSTRGWRLPQDYWVQLQMPPPAWSEERNKCLCCIGGSKGEDLLHCDPLVGTKDLYVLFRKIRCMLWVGQGRDHWLKPFDSGSGKLPGRSMEPGERPWVGKQWAAGAIQDFACEIRTWIL